MKNFIIIPFMLLIFSGCEDFVQVDLPDSLIGSEVVFENDQTALAAANGMYRAMLGSTGFIGGTVTNVTYMSAMSGDEVVSYSTTEALREFYQNNLSVANVHVLRIWSSAYSVIYEANAVLAGVTRSTALTPAVKNQLLAEARFVRAFSYFYLVNLFGDVPLTTTTDYRVNAVLTRTSIDEVYALIEDDLLTSRALLSDELTDRTRPGKAAVTALLARLSIYRGDYTEAVQYATEVIDDPSFLLEPLSNVFLSGSQEAIWQLTQVTPASNPTGDAALFTIFTNFFQNALSQDFVDSFEAGDQRATAWLKTWTMPDNTYYYAAKYKVRSASSTVPFTERLVVLRLAEQYLIRAEAHAELGDLPEAIADLDEVRERAGLNLIADVNPTISQEDLRALIAHERRIEFFCEAAHRWFDLKRTGKATVVLAGKANWTGDDMLYPIPETELFANPFLEPQNPGY